MDRRLAQDLDRYLTTPPEDGEAPAEPEPKVGFEWGQRVLIGGKPYWLNRCGSHGDCPSDSMTYHIIEGEPPEPEEEDEGDSPDY